MSFKSCSVEALSCLLLCSMFSADSSWSWKWEQPQRWQRKNSGLTAASCGWGEGGCSLLPDRHNRHLTRELYHHFPLTCFCTFCKNKSNPQKTITQEVNLWIAFLQFYFHWTHSWFLDHLLSILLFYYLSFSVRTSHNLRVNSCASSCFYRGNCQHTHTTNCSSSLASTEESLSLCTKCLNTGSFLTLIYILLKLCIIKSVGSAAWLNSGCLCFME